MKFLIDTNVISEYLKKTPNQKVLNWLDAQIEESLFISVLTVGEIEKGIAKIIDPARRAKYEIFLDNLILRFGDRILPVSLEAGRKWGDLTGRLEKTGRVLPTVDALLASTVLVAGDLTIVTRNGNDFAGTGVAVFDPWLQ